MPGDELLCPHAFLIVWFAGMKRLNNLCQCAMKSNELSAAGAGDVLDFGLENAHMSMFCHGIAWLVPSPS